MNFLARYLPKRNPLVFAAAWLMCLAMIVGSFDSSAFPKELQKYAKALDSVTPDVSGVVGAVGAIATILPLPQVVPPPQQPPPPLADGIPPSKVEGYKLAVAAAEKAGFTGEPLVTLVAIATPESGIEVNKPGDHNLPHRGCFSFGLFQINYCPDRDKPDNNGRVRWEVAQDYYKPTTAEARALLNAQAAWIISGQGTSFRPWTMYRHDRHRRYMPEARLAIKLFGSSGAG